MKNKQLLITLGAVVFLVGPFFARTQPVWRVDNRGNLTVDGEIFRVRGGSWTGLEGRQEPGVDQIPLEAPMELYLGDSIQLPGGRTYEQDIAEFAAMGFNLIRLPIAPQTLDAGAPQGGEPYLTNAESMRIENARLELETVIQLLDDAGIYVLLNIYSCSNFVGWRSGRLDARPPYHDSSWDNYNYTRDECSCSATGNPAGVTIIQAYAESMWLSDLGELAGLGPALGVSNIMGIDIFNEPWDYTWEEWRSMIDNAYAAVDAVNPNILIFAQGIWRAAGRQDDTPDSITQVPHGIEEFNPNWGENLYEAGSNPPSMPKDRLVFSPHAFGPSMFVQKMFMDPNQPECAGLEGDAAGQAQCNIVIDPYQLEMGWEEHFGYLKDLGYAVVIGAFGGNPDWPAKAELRDQDRYSYLDNFTLDWQWQNTFAAYLTSKGIRDAIYWSINPESYNTHGIYDHAYDPVVGPEGWGVWLDPEERKLELLHQLWGPETSNLTGDVNGDFNINLVDALMVAQYYVGLNPAGFIAGNADVSCNGSINIVDAFMIAEYYVGLQNGFDC